MEMGHTVAKIENPQAFGLPEVVEHLERWQGTKPKLWLELVKGVQAGTCVVWGGGTDGKLHGLAIVALPIDALAANPQVLHFHCTGGPRLRDLMVRAVVDFLLDKGYTGMWAINQSGKPDSVWSRAFAAAGKSRPIGSIMAFDLEKRK
jgi:hypothetical protein